VSSRVTRAFAPTPNAELVKATAKATIDAMNNKSALI
jgi:hypothetical protein